MGMAAGCWLLGVVALQEIRRDRVMLHLSGFLCGIVENASVRDRDARLSKDKTAGSFLCGPRRPVLDSRDEDGCDQVSIKCIVHHHHFSSCTAVFDASWGMWKVNWKEHAHHTGEAHTVAWVWCSAPSRNAIRRYGSAP